MKNEDLLNISVIFIIIILAMWVTGLKIEAKNSYNEKVEIMKLAVENHKLNQDYIDMLQESRRELNQALDDLNNELQEYKYLERIKKDLARH